MAGSNVPYQLRPNKFVERQLFLDLLDFVRVWNGPSQYYYASMGGRFLEDFKVIHERFAIKKMVSLECDEEVCKRQHFNRPFDFVDCTNHSSRRFVDEFDSVRADNPDRKFIVWLDHAMANDRGSQLEEFRDLISKLDSGDVAKLTVNASPGSVKERDHFRSGTDYVNAVILEIEKQLGDFFPSTGMAPDDVKSQNFAKVLAEAIKLAATSGNEANTNGNVLPLALYRYSDSSHQMLTATVLMASDQLAKSIADDLEFKHFPFKSMAWNKVHEVHVPDLSSRERDFIDQTIVDEQWPSTLPELPFLLDDENSEALLKSYILHYRRYPSFGRVRV